MFRNIITFLEDRKKTIYSAIIAAEYILREEKTDLKKSSKLFDELNILHFRLEEINLVLNHIITINRAQK
jgi:hypothetical protein